jgi:hypothetical protein
MTKEKIFSLYMISICPELFLKNPLPKTFGQHFLCGMINGKNFLNQYSWPKIALKNNS